MGQLFFFCKDISRTGFHIPQNSIIERWNLTQYNVKSGGDANVMYRVQVGAYSKKENADNQVKKLKSDGFDTYLIQVDGLYKVQVGAYSVKTNAENMIAKLKEKGYGCFITTKGGQAVSEA